MQNSIIFVAMLMLSAASLLMVQAAGVPSRKCTADDLTAYDEYLKSHPSKTQPISPEDRANRCAWWLENCKKVTDKAQSNPSGHTFNHGHSHFCDMTLDEQNQHKGATLPDKNGAHTRSAEASLIQAMLSEAEERTVTIPTTLNYTSATVTNNGSSIVCLAPIQNQASCGDCYAFAATAVFEFQYCKVHNKLVKFSEQMILDCDWMDKGCNGGWPTNAWSAVSSPAINVTNKPFYQSATYNGAKYNAVKGTCLASNTTIWTPNNSTYGMVQSYGNIAYGSPAPVNNIKTALTQYGPLAAAMMMGGTLMNTYKTGVYNDKTSANCMMGYTGNVINHAVVMVGYGTDATAGPFWIVRNSWGTTWGERGYFRIAAGSNLCNIESYLMYVTAFQ